MKKKPVFGHFVIVSEASATRLCGAVRAINETHVTIVKPVNQNSESYRALKEAFIDTKPQPVPEQRKSADSTAPGQTKPQTQTPALPKEADLAERTTKLAEEIDKFRLQQKVRYLIAPSEEERTQFQQMIVNYHNMFDTRVSKITAELEGCSVDVSKIREEVARVDTARSIAPIAFIITYLGRAANTIPEGQPKCGTGQPKPGFGIQQSGYYEVEMAGGLSGWPGGKGMEGRAKAILTSLVDNTVPKTANFPASSISVYLRDGLFCVDAKIVYGPFGAPEIDIVCNRVDTNIPPGWDTNFSENAVEVVNQNQRPVFQLIFVNPHRVQLNGIIRAAPNRYNVYFPGGWSKFTVNPDPLAPIEVPKELPLKPLFKYPAWNHRGESAN